MDSVALLQQFLANVPNIQQNGPLIQLMQQRLAEESVRESFWMQTIAILGLVANTTGAPVNVTTQSDGAFLIQGASYFCLNTAAKTNITENGLLVPLVLLTMVDQSGQGPMQDGPTPVTNLAGRGGVPMVWNTPKVIPPRGVLQITPQNIDTALAYDLYITFHGKKLLAPAA